MNWSGWNHYEGRGRRNFQLVKNTSSSLYASALTAELCLGDKSIFMKGFMRKTSMLIVLIKNTNMRYSIHLRSPPANSVLRAGFCGGDMAGGEKCLKELDV